MMPLVLKRYTAWVMLLLTSSIVFLYSSACSRPLSSQNRKLMMEGRATATLLMFNTTHLPNSSVSNQNSVPKECRRRSTRGTSSLEMPIGLMPPSNASTCSSRSEWHCTRTTIISPSSSS